MNIYENPNISEFIKITILLQLIKEHTHFQSFSCINALDIKVIVLSLSGTYIVIGTSQYLWTLNMNFPSK